MKTMEVCKTDIEKTIKYLEDAANLYDTTKRQKDKSRAWFIRRLAVKFRKKLLTI